MKPIIGLKRGGKSNAAPRPTRPAVLTRGKKVKRSTGAGRTIPSPGRGFSRKTANPV